MSVLTFDTCPSGTLKRMTTREHTVERTPILAERTIRCHLHPQLPIERTILNGLADMLRHESFRCRQVCDGASPFQDPVVVAGAELQFVHRHLEQLQRRFVVQSGIAGGLQRCLFLSSSKASQRTTATVLQVTINSRLQPLAFKPKCLTARGAPGRSGFFPFPCPL